MLDYMQAYEQNRPLPLWKVTSKEQFGNEYQQKKKQGVCTAELLKDEKSAIKRPKNCEIIYLRREASEFDTCFNDAHGIKHPALLAVYSKGELEQ